MSKGYEDIVNGYGKLLAPDDMAVSLNIEEIANRQVYDTVEQLYGMIWALAGGSKARVEAARLCHEDGIRLSPGKEKP